jgi:hypothetical protein
MIANSGPHRECLSALLTLALASACTSEPVATTSTGASEDSTGASEESSDSGSESDGDSESGDEPACIPAECDAQCVGHDECGEPYVGTCISPTECACETAEACLPCDPAACGPYEKCWDEWGICEFVCSQDFGSPLWTDVGCLLPLPADFPYEDWLYVELGGIELPFTDDCASLPEGWSLTPQADAIVLCDVTCAMFEAGAVISYGWGIPCE